MLFASRRFVNVARTICTHFLIPDALSMLPGLFVQCYLDYLYTLFASRYFVSGTWTLCTHSSLPDTLSMSHGLFVHPFCFKTLCQCDMDYLHKHFASRCFVNFTLPTVLASRRIAYISNKISLLHYYRHILTHNALVPISKQLVC